MENYKLFSTYKLGNSELKNHIVMAPMTRSRALGNIPNDLMAQYYEQRSGAGLIITEGTSPSPNGLGYARIPGIFNEDQIIGWKKVTTAVHKKNGKIFLQLMHCGRVGHSYNLPKGAHLVAPSEVKAKGQVFTDSNGMQDFQIPHSMTIEEVQSTKLEYVTAAKNAIAAGFDGIELHGANGYLPEQFISPFTNVRTDIYGGSVENRCRFVIEVANEVAAATGKDKTGIRLSPYGVASDMQLYPEIDATYNYLAEQLDKIGIVYIHIVDHSNMGAPKVPEYIKKDIREKFHNTVILAGGYSKETAGSVLNAGLADLIAFGKPFINNPDLVDRMKNNWPLSAELDFKTFYSGNDKGYTDYVLYKP